MIMSLPLKGRPWKLKDLYHEEIKRLIKVMLLIRERFWKTYVNE